ncbi:carboxylate--amine ligase [Azospirillum canadense]|uniref:carboxylate--amine ligase n=1 Tax=Azospirillum canadense TaxID=403962 RepID=UPI0022271745|nr:ATP-grasp domain-containing protein [Azospirillum canadense]MCW2238617.1 putative ATP-grasp superfamily ATP-dependent carboligase [Azospirillum canadense]
MKTIQGKGTRERPLAFVMGSMNLLRPIGLAGASCVAVTAPGSPTVHSRFTRAVLPWVDFSERTDVLVEKLVRLGAAQPVPPILFYEEDEHLLVISRHRETLGQVFRFVVADADLVEDLVDKNRFHALAERMGLPVPATRHLRPGESPVPPNLDLAFPLIVKPATRRDTVWREIGELGKARQVESPAAMRDLWPRMAASGRNFLAQEIIPGPESRIESYHVYVDAGGAIAGEFTGRKIRTYPNAYGHTTALTITDASDVEELGRSLTHRLNLRGVAKFDFKRGPDGRLHLLEINPRFNLWHFPGALAGVNLPALVYKDLTGQTRPAAARARAGVGWCNVVKDFAAARAEGIAWSDWLGWVLRCEAKSGLAWDDPKPFLRKMPFFQKGWPFRARRLADPAYWQKNMP